MFVTQSLIASLTASFRVLLPDFTMQHINQLHSSYVAFVDGMDDGEKGNLPGTTVAPRIFILNTFKDCL